MAEDDDESQKTEEPTPKKLQDALEKGEVAQSQELKTWFLLGTAALLVASTSDYVALHIAMPFRAYLGKLNAYDIDQSGLFLPLIGILREVLLVLLIPFFAFMVSGVVSNRIQHKGVFSLEKVKPSLKKISPMAGAKRMFSMQKGVEFFKISAKLVTVAIVIALIVYPERGRLDTVMLLPMSDALHLIKTICIQLLMGVFMVMTVISGLDYAYQKYQFIKKLRMTKQEVKDEHKQTEGDPKVKGRLRSIRMERARQRMMASVPNADVVITNPTHYAVALEYKHGEMDVPKLVAKGVDGIAFKIREIAEEHNVQIVENPPLARALHASVEIDEEIPPDQYKAVAGVISYVMKLRRAGLGNAAG